MAEPEDAARGARARAALGALDGLARCAEDLAGRASRLAPIEEGTLRGSFAVTLIINGTRFEGPGSRHAADAAVRAAALAGGKVRFEAEVSANTIYAARQHEELDWQHPLGGQAKYLEGPFLEQAPRYTRLIARAAARGL